MNDCYFFGVILEMSDYKFFYNSKIHNAKITLRIRTLDSNIRKGNSITLNLYDEVADYCYQKCREGDIIFARGIISSKMEIEIIELEK